MHIVVRADGGPEIGYGHLVRSGALAEELLSRGHAITLATSNPKKAETVFPTGVTTTTLPSRGDPEPFVRWLERATPDLVFTDAYPVDTAYQQAVRQCVPLAVLQDDARHAVCADLFVNGNLYASDLNYEFVGEQPKTCLGTEYVILRREIREQAARELPWREQPERAIVTMGGNDPTELTPTVLGAFDGTTITVDAIVGPGFSPDQERAVRTAAANASADFRVVRDPDDLVERMAAADFAVSTASTTTYELLALGTPIVSIPVVDNQRLIASALRDRDIAIVLEPEDDRAAIAEAIEQYIFDPALRRQIRDRGRFIVDANGVTRLATALLGCT